ncbi:AAA family ATPase [Phenylobacterium aquaticum]|jgi:predicted kinase|uniref:AAA family ATPase n=1 Tax=Phenylobacterium aquaticum TaxID=1763816 RepID=UPI001F5D38E6|nr:ATP-binding protein [Phenylobacterium aquaticum]MCI3131708.1 ATP-binding protein [Phenylobacterium aquaticum]
MSPVLHLICGLPGAGKSTLSRRLEAETGAVRLTSDEWLLRLGADAYDETTRAAVDDLQWELAQQLLQRGLSVILEPGFWTREERDRFRRRATELGACAQLHFLDVPRDELVRRLIARNADLPPGSYHVDPKHIDDWIPLFERPDADELDA